MNTNWWKLLFPCLFARRIQEITPYSPLETDELLCDDTSSVISDVILEEHRYQFLAILPYFMLVIPEDLHDYKDESSCRIWTISSKRGLTLSEDRPFGADCIATGNGLCSNRRREYLEPVFSYLQLPLEATNVWEYNFPSIKGYAKVYDIDTRNLQRFLNENPTIHTYALTVLDQITDTLLGRFSFFDKHGFVHIDDRTPLDKPLEL